MTTDVTPHTPHGTAVVDLLGLVAYGELTAFERLAADAGMAPTLDGKAELAGMAAAEFGHYRSVRARLVELGADPTEAMAPFADAVTAFHEHTVPADWLESLVKAYIGDALASDFHREAARFLDVRSRRVVEEVLEDTGHAAFVVEHVRTAIAADPRIGGRLALWGRRIMGEALTQAQQVATRREALAALLTGAFGLVEGESEEVTVVEGGSASAEAEAAHVDDLAEVGKMLTRLTVAHGRRMAALGLRA